MEILSKINYQNSPPSFDWDLFESDSLSSSKTRKHNQKVKRHDGDKDPVYSNAPYAQELYERLTGNLKNLKEPKLDTAVEGTITSVNKEYATVDINWREDAMIDLKKENPEYLKYIKVGYPIEVLIEKLGSKSDKFPIQASYSKNIISKKKDELISAIGQRVAYGGKVVELIHGGYFVDIEGILCFMPGSLGGMNKLVNFDSLIGKTIYVVPINYSKEKDYVVVSHREYLKSLIPEEISKLEFNKLYDGFVTGISKHGIFVEINGCLTGLIGVNDIHVSNIDDFNNKKINPGDHIQTYVKEVGNEEKIVLTQNLEERHTIDWNEIHEKYKVPCTVTGKVKKIVRYGIFIELESKIVGLLHKSNIDETVEIEVGQEIEVNIINIDKENRKIDFSM